jgi:DNA-binding response OmpR family regulator
MDGVRIDGSRREVAWEDATVALAPREASAPAAMVADPGAPVGSADLARSSGRGARWCRRTMSVA